MARKAGRKNLYSEQDIIDCDRGNEGCDGGKLHFIHQIFILEFIQPQGWPATAIKFVKTSGIANGSSYIYEGVRSTCKRKKFRPFRFKIPNVCSYDLNGDEKKLQALVDHGPVIVCIGNFLKNVHF